MDEKIQLKDRPLLPDNEIADTSFTHVAQGGRDYKAYVRNFKQKIENNLTTSTTGSGLDATQGKELKRLNDFNQNANRILFYFNDAITTTVDGSQNVSVELPSGIGSMPNKIPYSILAFSGTMPLNSVLKLQYYPEFNNFQWSIVNDPTTTNEGADSNIFYIAKNLNGSLLSVNGSFNYFTNSCLSNIVEDTTPQLGGFLDTNGKAIQESQGADIASATNLAPLQDGNFFNVTGTTTINAIITTGVWRTGSEITLRFTGICLLTHNGTVTGNNKPMWLDKGANYTTAANDILVLRLDGTYWREVNKLTKSIDLSGITTRNYVNPTVSGGVLTFDFNGKNECFANKSGGGAIDVASNITVAYSNATNFKTLWAAIEVTGATRTVTFPSAHKSGDSRWSSLVLTLPIGFYQISVMYNGSYYHVTCSNAEV